MKHFTNVSWTHTLKIRGQDHGESHIFSLKTRVYVLQELRCEQLSPR